MEAGTSCKLHQCTATTCTARVKDLRKRKRGNNLTTPRKAKSLMIKEQLLIATRREYEDSRWVGCCWAPLMRAKKILIVASFCLLFRWSKPPFCQLPRVTNKCYVRRFVAGVRVNLSSGWFPHTARARAEPASQPAAATRTEILLPPPRREDGHITNISDGNALPVRAVFTYNDTFLRVMHSIFSSVLVRTRTALVVRAHCCKMIYHNVLYCIIQ